MPCGTLEVTSEIIFGSGGERAITSGVAATGAAMRAAHDNHFRRLAMMITLSRLYTDPARARAVVDELKASGLPEDDIGVIAASRRASHPMENAGLQNADDRIDRDRDGHDDRNEAVAKGAGLGAAAGILAGLSAFVLPGIGTVAAAGWLTAALAGAVAGGAAGGVVGALVESGIDENDAAGFADGIKRGGTLVTVRVMDEDRDHYEDILSQAGVRGGANPGYDPAGMPVQLRDIGQNVAKPYR